MKKFDSDLAIWMSNIKTVMLQLIGLHMANCQLRNTNFVFKDKKSEKLVAVTATVW